MTPAIPGVPRPYSGSLRAVWMYVLLAPLSLSMAAAPIAKHYDLPAGTADKSLKFFSEQTGLEVIFSTKIARAVKTNPVKGEMTARQALDAMLADTGLAIIQDQKTGAFTVSRNDSSPRVARPESPGNGSRDSQKKNMTETPQTQEPMKRNRLVAALAATIAVVIAPVAHPAENRVANGDAEKAIELSPFVVSSERDTGYQATSTLAGTRLNTPIEDIGAAISIYTKDFLEDIGSTEHREFLIYATGMEATGPQGNIAGFTSPNDTGTGTLRADPDGGAGFGVAIRTRGLSVPTRTRGFFVTDIPSDSYNVDRVTVNRGPNSILFGVGNPGGIIDSTLSRANLLRNMNKVQMRYGDNDSIRASVDFNRVLIKDKLAARVAALHSREEYDQRPAFEEKRRIYGTVTYEPFKSTAIRANFETGGGNANRPYTVPPRMNYGAWEQAGRQPFDWTFYDDPARNPDAAAQNVQNFFPLDQSGTRLGARVVAVFPDPKGTAPVSGFSNRIRLHAPNGNVFDPVFNRDSTGENFQFINTHGINQLPASWWPGGQTPAGSIAGGQTFTDYSAFDWRKRMLYESGRQTHSFNTFNIAVEQRALKDHVGVELAYDRQRYHARLRQSGDLRSEGIRIDTNVTLPTGEPNPNLGRPYATTNGVFLNNSFFAREGMRATAYIKYDFRELNESWGKWLGHHIVTGLVEQSALEKLRGDTRFQVDGPAALQASADVLNGNRQYRALVYLGPSVIGNNNQVRLESVRIPTPQNGDTFMTTYYDPASGGLVTAPTTLVEFFQNSSPGAIRDVIKSRAVAMQSYWLQEHLVTLVGWRRDRDYFQQFNLITARNASRTGPNDPGQVFFGLDEFDFARTPAFLAGNEIISYSAVLKWPKRLLTLPAGADLSVFYNRSDNFTPTGGQTDMFFSPLEPPTGETEEYGINVSAFGGKLNLRLNRFETRVVNQTIVRGGLPTTVPENGVTQAVAAWTREANRNPGNVAFMDAAITRLLSPLPSTWMQDRSFTVSGAAPDITTAYDRPQSSDTTDFTATGTEVEIIYNPTRNWRIMANVAKTETIQTNLYPITKAFMELMAPVWDSTITDPVSGATVNFRDIPIGGYPEGFGPANPPGANVASTQGTFINNQNNALASARATEGQVSAEQRKWRVNFVTNYTFGRDALGGKLYGWGVGGGYRWQSKIALGYPSSRDANGVVSFDIANPYWGDAESNLDAWVSYRRKIWNDRIDWKVQLNVKNLIGGTDLIPIRSQPWGEVASVRVPPEKRWYIANTFSF